MSRRQLCRIPPRTPHTFIPAPSPLSATLPPPFSHSQFSAPRTSPPPFIPSPVFSILSRSTTTTSSSSGGQESIQIKYLIHKHKDPLRPGGPRCPGGPGDLVMLKSQRRARWKILRNCLSSLAATKCQVLVFSWEWWGWGDEVGGKNKEEEHHLNNVSVSFSATLPNPTSLSPRFILRSPREESTVFSCNTQHALHTPATLTPHACARTHVPDHHHAWWIETKQEFDWVCFQSEHRLNSPLFFLCDIRIVCPNVVHLKWKGVVLHGKDYFKDNYFYFGWISMLCSDFDPIHHYCMGLISQYKGCSPRLGLIWACILQCSQRDIHKMCWCSCVLSVELKVFSSFSFFHPTLLFHIEK